MAVEFNQPILKRDANGNVIQESYISDMQFRGEYTTGNLIYRGYARPQAVEGDNVWQIAELTYVGSDLTEINWPQDANGNPSSEFIFSWTARATYTYGPT